MEERDWIWVGISIVVAIVIFVIRLIWAAGKAVVRTFEPSRPTGYYALTDEQVQSAVELRVASFIIEFPRANGEQIAAMVCDELLNARVHDRRYFYWATAETANRIVRTAALMTVREERDGQRRKPLIPAEKETPIPYQRKCPRCAGGVVGVGCSRCGFFVGYP